MLFAGQARVRQRTIILVAGCRSGCRLGWAEGSMCYMGARWRNLVIMTVPSVCCDDAALCRNSEHLLLGAYSVISLTYTCVILLISVLPSSALHVSVVAYLLTSK